MTIFSRSARIGFASRLAGERRLVGRIHVGRGRGELGRAGVDALEHRLNAEPSCARRRRRLRPCRRAPRGARRRSRSPSARAYCRRRAAGRARAPCLRARRSRRSARGTRGRSCCTSWISSTPMPKRIACATLSRRSGVGWPIAARSTLWSSPWPSPSISISSSPSRPVSSERSAFCSDSGKVRPIAIASPTDFIAVVSVGSAPGNFSNAKRGILVTM